MLVVISIIILPFLLFLDTISITEAKVYILQQKTNNLNDASENDDAHTNARTDVFLKFYDIVLNKEKEVKSTENKCMRLFSSIYGTKEDKLKCLKNMKKKRLEKAKIDSIASKFPRPYLNKFTDLTRISEDYVDTTDLLRNSKISSDYIDLRSRKPLLGKQPNDIGNLKKKPNFSIDYINFDDWTRLPKFGKNTKGDGKMKKNPKLSGDYIAFSDVRTRRPRTIKPPKVLSNLQPIFSNDYIDFGDLRTQRPRTIKPPKVLSNLQPIFSNDYIDFGNLRTRRPRTKKPPKVLNNLRPIVSNDYIDFADIRTRKALSGILLKGKGEILSESLRKSLHHSYNHNKHESKVRTAYSSSSDDESVRFNSFAENLKQKRAAIDPKRFQVIGNSMNQLGMTDEIYGNSDFQSSSEEVSKPISHKYKKQKIKTGIKKNKYYNSDPTAGKYYKPVKNKKINKVELTNTESSDSSLSEEFEKPVRIKSNHRKPVNSLKYNKYDSFSSDDSKPIRNKQKNYMKHIQTDDSESFEREQSKPKPRKIKQNQKLHFNENAEWDSPSEEYTRPIKTRNIKGKETYLQGNHVITVRNNNGRRLERFLPKRFDWSSEEMKDLGYFWFNGPQGKFSHLRLRPQ